MPYFLKKSNLKKGTYLQIYRSYYNPEKKGGSNKCYKTLGYLDALKASGIDDPIAYYTEEIKSLNENLRIQRDKEKVQQISDQSPCFHLGYFPYKAILNSLKVEPYISLFSLSSNFDFDIFKCMQALVFSRLINPCSKRKTFNEVIPSLWEKYDFSYNQLLDCTEYLGSIYEKIVEIFTAQVAEVYKIDTSITFFDCTNYYFEIDLEDLLRKKGPSKENRKAPIIGMGLLLDANCIPIGMKLYPGNESEKPVLRNVIKSLKSQNNIKGRTVQVADKGLNCGQNIYEALKNKDGYIFSKSVKTLSEVEKKWVLLERDYKTVYSENRTVKYKYKSCIDSFSYSFKDVNNKTRRFTVKEKRVVTYNPKLAKKHKIEIKKMVEKANRLTYSAAKKSEYGESARYVTFASTDKDGNVTDEKIAVGLNLEKIQADLDLAGYNMLVTSELKMNEYEIYDTYHHLWRIEETFRVLKSDLDARPVYLQKENSIKGHFLVCYVAVLLMRILQFKILDNKYSSGQIDEFVKNFQVVKNGNTEILNISKNSAVLQELGDLFNLPLTNYRLTKTDVKKVLNAKIPAI